METDGKYFLFLDDEVVYSGGFFVLSETKTILIRTCSYNFVDPHFKFKMKKLNGKFDLGLTETLFSDWIQGYLDQCNKNGENLSCSMQYQRSM